MSRFVNYNGDLVQEGRPLFDSRNRAFRYGDGLFETIRVFDGKIPFLKLHMGRLLSGLKILKFEPPPHFQGNFFKSEIEKITMGTGNHRVRLTVFRPDGGWYTPEHHFPQFLIESFKMDNNRFSLNKTGLKIGRYDECPLYCQIISPLKTNNGLPYILAGIYAKSHGFDDCLLLNGDGNVVESISSNLFAVLKGQILTPPLSEGCVSGTMRSLILKLAKENGFEIKEIKVSLALLMNAEEIWLTNAIQGIRWVGRFEGKNYGNTMASRFLNYLNNKLEE